MAHPFRSVVFSLAAPIEVGAMLPRIKICGKEILMRDGKHLDAVVLDPKTGWPVP
jgi:hypothetical protein